MSVLHTISIAVPDSLFLDEDNLRGKTLKASQLARAVSIFGVERVYIYRDASQNFDRDYEVAKDIFQYAETPQYLRKRLISKKSDLEYAGLISPLRIPHHLKDPRPSLDEVREAVLSIQNGELVADVGSKELALYVGKGQAGQRITVRIVSTKPLRAERTNPPVNTYWGYEIRRAPSLARFLRSANFELIILTSRLGESLNEKWAEFSNFCRSAQNTLICFGSPDNGIDFMLEQDNAAVKDFPKALHLNFFPYQNVATVRLEEAVLGCLAIANLAIKI